MQITLKPYTIFCHDNLPVLRGINSHSIDLIYLDPPFNKGRQFHAPVGTKAEGAGFNDIWHEESVKDEWHLEIKERLPALFDYLKAVERIGSRSAKYYLIYMAVRLIEMHRILKDTGSLYLHCDPTASHYLKLLLDTIFGHKKFINEIVWCYHGPGSPKMKQFSRKHDVIFWYGAGSEWIFHADAVRQPYKDPSQTLRKAFHTEKNQFDDPKNINLYRERGKIPEDWWELRIAARSKKEYVGYPTQKPLALLERIIEASCPKEGLVLDPFCGCATTCIAAERLGRKWIGIDVSPRAFELVKARIQKEVPEDLLVASPPRRIPVAKRR